MPTLTLARRASAHPAPRLAPRRTPARLVSPSESMKLRILSKWEILELLYGDFLRECREVCACARWAERMADDPATAKEIAQRGQRAILHSFELGQIILHLGGTVPTGIDAAESDVDCVLRPEWAAETAERLRERASHLILLDEIGLSVRMFRLIKDKRSLSSLAALVGNN